MKYSDMDHESCYVVSVQTEDREYYKDFFVWWNRLDRKYPGRYPWTVAGHSFNDAFSEDQIKAWIDEQPDTTLMRNYDPVRPYSFCAECEGPIYYSLDYLCVNCRI